MLVVFARRQNLNLSTKIMYIGPSFLMLMDEGNDDLDNTFIIILRDIFMMIKINNTKQGEVRGTKII